MIKFVVGNKSDVEKQERRVTHEQGKELVKDKATFFETSAALNDGNIDDLFNKLTIEIQTRFDREELRATV